MLSRSISGLLIISIISLSVYFYPFKLVMAEGESAALEEVSLGRKILSWGAAAGTTGLLVGVSVMGAAIIVGGVGLMAITIGLAVGGVLTVGAGILCSKADFCQPVLEDILGVKKETLVKGFSVKSFFSTGGESFLEIFKERQKLQEESESGGIELVKPEAGLKPPSKAAEISEPEPSGPAVPSEEESWGVDVGF